MQVQNLKITHRVILVTMDEKSFLKYVLVLIKYVWFNFWVQNKKKWAVQKFDVRLDCIFLRQASCLVLSYNSTEILKIVKFTTLGTHEKRLYTILGPYGSERPRTTTEGFKTKRFLFRWRRRTVAFVIRSLNSCLFCDKIFNSKNSKKLWIEIWTRNKEIIGNE